MDINRNLASSIDQYSVGVVGAGHIAVHYHLPILETLDATSIEFIADINTSAANRAASTYDTKSHSISDVQSIPDCDIVLLSLPVADREPYIIEFSDRDTAIFSEKPFAIDINEHERYLDLTNKVTCNYTRMEYGSTKQMAAIVNSDVFGNVDRIVVKRGNPQKSTGKSESQTEPQFRGGMLHEHGTHLLSQLTSVSDGSKLSVLESTINWSNGIEIDLKASLTLTTGEENVPVSFEFSLIRDIRREIKYEFEHATVRYDPSQPTARLSIDLSPGVADDVLTFATPDQSPQNHHQAIAARWIRFLNSCESGDFNPRFQTGIQISRVLTETYNKSNQWPEGTA
jgi:predicted dehydrogenase